MEELPIIQKTYDLIKWYIPILNRLPTKEEGRRKKEEGRRKKEERVRQLISQ